MIELNGGRSFVPTSTKWMLSVIEYDDHDDYDDDYDGVGNGNDGNYDDNLEILKF